MLITIAIPIDLLSSQYQTMPLLLLLGSSSAAFSIKPQLSYFVWEYFRDQEHLTLHIYDRELVFPLL